ncbi:MAG: EMC3/TMCO1 family protein [Candidatus Pacearchaeota archaeon]
MDKKGSFKPVVIIMIISLLIASLWDKWLVIKNTAHSILNPTAGALLNWDVTWGMIIIIFGISIIMTLAQKYGTDQKTIKEIKDEQKRIQKEMKEVKNNPEKVMEFQKELMPLTMELMKHSMRPIVYTGIPIILFFRWFSDYFAVFETPVKFLGIFSWFWFYLIGSIIFSTILRKIFKVH